MKSFDFTGVEAASEKTLTSPGTRAVFKCSEVKFDISQNGKDFMEVTFDNNSSSFRHRFYMTEGAYPRVQFLHKAIYNGDELTGAVNETQLIAKFKDKEVALKVGGRVGNDGKGYPDLGFGGFAKHPTRLAELEYSTAEQAAVDEALEANRNYNNASPDAENNGQAGAPAPAATGTADDF